MPAVGRPTRTFPGRGDAPRVVRDSDGNALELEDQPIGRGGQGAVYRIRYTRYAAKLLEDDPAAALGESLAERLTRLRWLPLEGLPVSRPVRPLALPHIGYIMDLLDDMEPIAALCEPPEGPLEPWYLNGGGLRRRLRLLARCAASLATLHGRGLVYGDISPDNVLVSAAAKGEEVWLIDPDNIAIESSARQRAVWTRLYRAPEIARQHSGNTPFSDAYSFAILAYQTLRADHPLVGDLTCESVQLEEDAERGLLPWTGHSTDARNRSGCGITEDKVLTRGLAKLFKAAFEDGLTEPLLRPTPLAWAAELSAAADRTVVCRGRDCGQTCYAFAAYCPFCRAVLPDMVLVGIRDQVPARLGLQGDKPVISDPPTDRIVLQADEPFVVTTRHSQLVAGTDESRVLRLRWRSDGFLSLENIGRTPVRWVPPAGGVGRLLAPGAAPALARVEDGWRVHFGDDQRMHRVLTFEKPARQGA